MRHVWVHEEFDQHYTRQDSESEKWLKQFADRWNMDYNQMIEEASGKPGGYSTAMGIDLHSKSELGGDESLFWEHLEKLIGRKFDENHRNEFQWSCSC